MKLKVLILLLFAVLYALCADVRAYNSGYSGAYLRYGAGAREIALGRAYSAAAENSNAVFSNPALLAFAGRGNTRLNYAQLFEGDYDSSVSFSVPLSTRTGFGMGIITRKSDGYLATDIYNEALYETGMSQDCAFISGSRYFDTGTAIGLSLKPSYESYDRNYFINYGLDLGLSQEVSIVNENDFRLGLFLQDVFSFGSGINSYIPTYRAGFVFRTFNSRLSVTSDIFSASKEIYLDRLSWYAGLELKVNRFLVLRAGVNKTEFSAGTGFRIRNIEMDYAYTSHNYLGAVHRATIGFVFGKEPPPEEKEKGKQEEKTEPIISESEKKLLEIEEKNLKLTEEIYNLKDSINSLKVQIDGLTNLLEKMQSMQASQTAPEVIKSSAPFIDEAPETSPEAGQSPEAGVILENYEIQESTPASPPEPVIPEAEPAKQ